MSESSMVGKCECRTSNATQDIEIRRLGRQCERQCGERGFAIESGTSQASAGKKVGYRFQEMMSILSLHSAFDQ